MEVISVYLEEILILKSYFKFKLSLIILCFFFFFFKRNCIISTKGLGCLINQGIGSGIQDDILQ